MANYYPSLVVNFRIVFDETLTITTTLPTPTTVDDAARGAGGFAQTVVQPLVSGRGKQSNVLGRVPKAATIELPGHRPAGRFSLTFDFRELPIDPRTVRSCAVDIFLGTVSPDAFEEGMSGQSKRSVLDASTLEPLMTALVDEWEVEHGEDGSEISVSGRDLRGFLIDTPIATNPKDRNQILDKLNLSQPINLVIQELLGKHPLTAGFKIVVLSADGEWDQGVPPAPNGVGGIGAGRTRKGAKGTRASGRLAAASSQDKLTFWDLIVKLCFMVGAIPHFVGSSLRVRPARSLYDRKFAGFDPAIPTPFEAGLPRVIDAETEKTISPLSIRRMVYGRDIESMRFTRKFGGFQRPHQVVCTAVDTLSPLARGAARQIQGVFPSNEIATRVAASGQTAMTERMFVPVSGICDVDQLSRMAEAVYNEIGRGEIGGTCSTKTLASFGGDNQDADLLRLRPGDAVEFKTDVRQLRNTAPLVSEFTDHLRTPFERQVDAVAARIGDKNVARVIVATAQGQINEVQGFFRVAAVHYTWGEDGIKVDFDFQNFVEVTYEQNKTGPKPGALDTRAVPKQALTGQP